MSDKPIISHICHFSSADHLVGKKRTYESVREAVLKAGRYSVFEATESQKNAALFMRLDKDPTIERFQMGYPWIGVRLRAQTEHADASPADTAREGPLRR